MASVVVAHVAAALALFFVPVLALPSPWAALWPFGTLDPDRLSAVLRALALALVLASLGRGLHGERAKAGRCFVLADDGVLEAEERVARNGAGGAPRGGAGGAPSNGAGDNQAALVLYRVVPASAVDLGWALWFAAVPLVAGDARARPFRLMLVAANVGAPSWRMLRIWLRHKALRVSPAADEADAPGAGGAAAG